MKWVEIEWNSKKIKVPVQKRGGKLWFHLDGETHAVEVQSGRKKGASSTNLVNGEIKAPMPGKILKVFVKENEEVKQGQALLAMEAMKMEYTLEADQDGTITTLNANVGSQVALGELLVKIEGKK